nr:mucin-13-like isoform X1 [Meriones unguiculatus]XP_021495937.1 mucin-13-like isoform X1 [Meriones unguiculatus]
MKAFLLVSLSLLLVIEVSPSGTDNVTTTSASTSTELPVTAQSNGNSASASLGTAPDGQTSAQTPAGSTQPASAVTSPNIDANSSVDPSSTSPPEGTTQPDNNSSVPSETTQPPDGQGTNQPTNTSTQPPLVTSPNIDANSSVDPSSTSPPGGITQPDGNSSLPSGTTQPPNATEPPSPDLCKPDSCGGKASCVNLYSIFICLCSEGWYYNSSSSLCERGKTFPGEITMKFEAADLQDKTSKNYQKLQNHVENFFKNIFKDDDFGQTVILKVSPTSFRSARSAMTDKRSNIFVSFINMFGENTSQNETTVTAAIEKAANDSDDVSGYTNINVCDYRGCVDNGTDICQDALQCTCKPGLKRLHLLSPFCVSVSCAEPCSTEDRKQCITNDDGTRECVCMAGYQKANGKCEECPFGYSGVDCKDPFQLILTIVGTVAGALILILLIAFIVSVRSTKKKKDVEEQNLIEDDFHNVRLQQTGFSNFGADKSIFPKVRTGIPSQTSNPYANQRSMPRPDY